MVDVCLFGWRPLRCLIGQEYCSRTPLQQVAAHACMCDSAACRTCVIAGLSAQTLWQGFPSAARGRRNAAMSAGASRNGRLLVRSTR